MSNAAFNDLTIKVPQVGFRYVKRLLPICGSGRFFGSMPSFMQNLNLVKALHDSHPSIVGEVSSGDDASLYKVAIKPLQWNYSTS